MSLNFAPKEIMMKKFWYVMLVLVYLLLICHFSNQSSSQQDLRPFIEEYPQVVEMVQEMPRVQFYYCNQVLDSREEPVQFIQMFIRKMVHLLMYGFLGILLLQATGGLRGVSLRRWFLVALLVLAAATFDEVNQISTPQRTGCREDVLVDLTGYFLFSLLVLPLMYRRGKNG